MGANVAWEVSNVSWRGCYNTSNFGADPAAKFLTVFELVQRVTFSQLSVKLAPTPCQVSLKMNANLTVDFPNLTGLSGADP